MNVFFTDTIASVFLAVFLGYKCELFNNPADFFLDITNGDITPTQDSSDAGNHRSL